MSGHADKKPATSEGLSDELKKYSKLMREMGSPNGAWNPEPDAHITALLRPDIRLSSNEIKAIAYVKHCTIGAKGERVAWGKTESGLPLIKARITDRLGWKSGNTDKWIKRPLAYGLIRVNDDGVYGLGAQITGSLKAGEEKANQEIDTICTDSIPNYLSVAIKGLSDSDREKFVTGWSDIETEEEKAIAEAVARVREATRKKKAELCQNLGVELKSRKESKTSARPNKLSVQKQKPMLYKVETESVQIEIPTVSLISKDKVQSINKHSLPTPSQEPVERQSEKERAEANTADKEGEQKPIKLEAILRLVQKIGMSAPPSDRAETKRVWDKLPPVEQHKAVFGLETREEIGEYDEIRFIPKFLRYLREKMWEHQLRPRRKSNGVDTSYLKQVVNGENIEGNQQNHKAVKNSYLSHLINGSDHNGD